MKKSLLAKIGLSSGLAFMTGLGMMPIFDDDIKSLTEDGLDWEDNEYISPIIALNTLMIFSILANYFYLNYFIEDQRDFREDRENDEPENEFASNMFSIAAGAVSLCAAALPVSQLWVVETENQQYAESSGFDQYIAWATFTTIPILLNETITCYASLKDQFQRKLLNVDLDSVGDKLFLYTPVVMSIPGRFISYYYSTYFLAKEIGLPEEIAIGTGIIVGGLIGSSVIGAIEYGAMKSLFQKQEGPLKKLDILLGSFCALEGCVLALPMVATGMDVIEDQSAFLKSALYSPVFITSSVLKSKIIHEVITGSYKAMQQYCCVGVDSFNDILRWEDVTNEVNLNGSDSNLYEEIN